MDIRCNNHIRWLVVLVRAVSAPRASPLEIMQMHVNLFLSSKPLPPSCWWHHIAKQDIATSDQAVCWRGPAEEQPGMYKVRGASSLIPGRALVLCKLWYTLVFNSLTFYLLFYFFAEWKIQVSCFFITIQKKAKWKFYHIQKKPSLQQSHCVCCFQALGIFFVLLLKTECRLLLEWDADGLCGIHSGWKQLRL